MRTQRLMILGTGSTVGKSLLTAGLCRVLKQEGVRVTPFKSQNMALNSYITADGFEMGRAQVMQAEAAGLLPDVRMNPVLLKPTGERRSQVVLMGKAIGTMDAVSYHQFKPELKGKIRSVFEDLAAEFDTVLLEGAGSPAEINLREGDIVNMGMAELVDAPAILVGDIDKGGVFAQLVGTMVLLSEEEKKRIRGFVINKFRGDVALLRPGLRQLEEITGVPVLGVLPWTPLDLDDEDSVSDRLSSQRPAGETDIVVIRLPRMSNFTDFNIFETLEGVSLRYVDRPERLGNPDMIILPGTKNTLEDLLAIRQSGMADAVKRLHSAGTPVFGVCGGYQMMGTWLHDPHGVESDAGSVEGLGLLNVETTMETSKVTVQTDGTAVEGLLPGAAGGQPFRGYEIHMGRTTAGVGVVPFLKVSRKDGHGTDEALSACSGHAWGTYIHGVFDGYGLTGGLVNGLRASRGLPPLDFGRDFWSDRREKEFDKLADMIRQNLDMDAIRAILRTSGEETSWEKN